MQMNIFLIGFMGSGKSSIGKKLAGKLEYEFFDVDNVIEKNTGKTISEIFSEEGEGSFREYEQQALLQLSNKKNAVIATGGGTPCFHNNMQMIKKTGISVYIKRSPEYLKKILKQSKQNRPLVASKSADELDHYIFDMLIKREPYYLKADYTIENEDTNIESIVSALLKKFSTTD